nr:lipocalin-like domain-containing protein [Bradyrhizobium sediminis]
MHRYSEAFARGGVGQAGVEPKPFQAWIDSWAMRGVKRCATPCSRRSNSPHRAPIFSYTLRLDADRPLVLQGNAGYSRKSERGQASYYYSQPFFKATGRISIGDKPAGGRWASLDGPRMEQPAARPDQTGWDWFSLHLDSGEKLMLYRLRQKDGRADLFGNWIEPDGRSSEIASSENTMTPTGLDRDRRPQDPDRMEHRHPARGLRIETTPLNARSWMGTSFLTGRDRSASPAATPD